MATGFAHPFGGADHVLAMIMVGLLAARMGRRAVWTLPATFLAVLVVGGILGHIGLGLPFVEVGIALSVVVLGAVLAFGSVCSVATAQTLVGAFAVFHGYAHGTEMPAAADGLGYGVGFIAATAILHLAGLGIGIALERAASKGPQLVKAVGGAASLAGLGILVGAV